METDVKHRAVAADDPKLFVVLDTQVYSNTGGQSSTASFMGQNTKFSVHGTVIPGKIERRKELAQICMMHRNTFVAQTGLCSGP